jgi:hypothetical protein
VQPGAEEKAFRLVPILFAILLAYPAMQPQSAQAAIPASSPQNNTNNLPDLGSANDRTGSVSVRPNGVTLESTFDQKKIVVAPEYSNQTGLSIGAALASMLGDNAAIGVILTAGSDKKELLLNAGFKFDERQRFILTAGQIEQYLDYAFRSGTEKVGATQNSGGISYQLQLGAEFLRYLEVNGYVAKTDSRDLADKTFAIDTATLYELWNDPRRIAGGKTTGLQGRLGFSPLAGSLVKVSLGQERLSYDLLNGTDSVNRVTGGVEWAQQLGNGYNLKMAADTFASQNRYTLDVERSLSGNHHLGVSLVGLRGRDGLGDDNQIKLTYSYGFGAGSGHAVTVMGNTTTANATSTPNTTKRPASLYGNNLLDQVATRPAFIPSHVIAKIDTTAAPVRQIAIDKTALAAGSSVNTATGAITTPLGVVVTGIAGVTKNAAPFANSGQFALSGNNLITDPNKITQPAVGVTDTYVVTVSISGGGTLLATVTVTHGSVKVDSIVISSGVVAAAPTASAVSISGTTQAGQLLTGSYTYADANGDPQGTSTFRWLRNGVAIVGATASTYTLVAADVGNPITFEVTPVSTVAPTTGTAVASAATAAVTLPAGYVSQGGLTWMPNNAGSATFGGDFNNWGIPGGYTDWNTANTYCTSATILGQTGWRLPTTTELSALYSSGAINAQGWTLAYTWSSTPHGAGGHEDVSLYNGGVNWYFGAYYNYVTCVR